MAVNDKIGDIVLVTTIKEKDLGVTISADIKISEQCDIAALKDNQILGLIGRNMTCKKTKLYLAKASIKQQLGLIRSHSEYCIQTHSEYKLVKGYKYA